MSYSALLAYSTMDLLAAYNFDMGSIMKSAANAATVGFITVQYKYLTSLESTKTVKGLAEEIAAHLPVIREQNERTENHDSD